MQLLTFVCAVVRHSKEVFYMGKLVVFWAGLCPLFLFSACTFQVADHPDVTARKMKVLERQETELFNARLEINKALARVKQMEKLCPQAVDIVKADIEREKK
jgi:hypothetical protein